MMLYQYKNITGRLPADETIIMNISCMLNQKWEHQDVSFANYLKQNLLEFKHIFSEDISKMSSGSNVVWSINAKDSLNLNG